MWILYDFHFLMGGVKLRIKGDVSFQGHELCATFDEYDSVFLGVGFARDIGVRVVLVDEPLKDFRNQREVGRPEVLHGDDPRVSQSAHHFRE